MNLLKVKTHDTVSGQITYECTSALKIPAAVEYERKESKIISVIIPTEEMYLDMGDRAQKVIPGRHVIIVEPNGAFVIWPQEQLDKNFTAVAAE